MKLFSKLYMITLLLLLLCNSNRVFCQLASHFHYVSDFKFNSIFGINHNDENSIYCLLGKEFLGAPRSENADILIENWLKERPKAIVIPVAKLTGTDDVSFIYSWIAEGSDTLNIHLIKQGAFTGGTMIRPRTTNKLGEVEIFVSKPEYEKFLQQVKIAEQYAFENKLGVWSSFKE